MAGEGDNRLQANEFIRKWRGTELTERAAAQSHFIDLCRVLREPTPSDADPKGDWYAFEKGALKTGGGDGWADVWKRGCFAWEYKGKRKNLDDAYVQLQRYAVALENPPLLIVSDMERFRIHTNWTNTVQQQIELPLEDLADERRRRLLKHAFSEEEVEQLKPKKNSPKSLPPRSPRSLPTSPTISASGVTNPRPSRTLSTACSFACSPKT